MRPSSPAEANAVSLYEMMGQLGLVREESRLNEKSACMKRVTPPTHHLSIRVSWSCYQGKCSSSRWTRRVPIVQGIFYLNWHLHIIGYNNRQFIRACGLVV
jgi:hypothetical protein